MNYRILIIYLISFLLLSIFSNGTRKENSNKNNMNHHSFLFARKVHIRRNFESLQMGQLLLSYTTGDRIGLSKHVKDVHNQLYIMHLFIMKLLSNLGLNSTWLVTCALVLFVTLYVSYLAVRFIDKPIDNFRQSRV